VPGADDNRGMIHDNALIPGDSVSEENHETKVESASFLGK